MNNIDFYCEITQIEDIVELGTTLTHSWFRGQPQTYGNLTPGAFRKQHRNLLVKENRELKYTEHFKRRAPAYSNYTPEDLDHLEWLFVMQHHGSPTRLLDWTENSLVALYFAVNSKKNKDGELWAIYPDELNNKSLGRFGIELARSKYVNFLAGEPFHNDTEQLKVDLKLEREVKGPIALYPPMRFQRMINQMSVFTIQPDPQKSSSVTDLLSEDKHIVRYLIRKSCKEKLLRKLNDLGIRESILFPSLVSLSKSIKEEMKTVAYSPPKPPIFSKE